MASLRTLVWLSSFLVVACAAHGSGDAPDPTPRVLVAASNFLHPPFSSRDASATPVGIEVDLVAEAARSLGRTVRWQERPFRELLDAVAAGEVDVAASTIGITEERARRVAFTRPYHETTIVALVRAAPEEPRRLADLAGRRIGTERGTTAVGAVAARIPQAVRVLDADEGASWAEMLRAGTIDAVVLDRSHAERFMADAGTRFHVISEPLRVERFGLAVHDGATELRAALDAAIARRR